MSSPPLLKPDLDILAGRRHCELEAGHTPRPTFTRELRFLDWARGMEQTHRLTQCTGCGLWVVWVPKTAVEA